ncbi:mannonate dehydratase [Amphibacillus cookii]|uniref:mannonate dehydratase n=1 Tax=Amphibacillus cookii TaxID=767787 RepID=UPI00195BB93A|nr:mannonate dehydratase [Amphibacillus cookii]MBM7540305.1 mannonate dehydratase [Amphibacillus cookii]
MRMVFRWFGKENDPVPLTHIKQVPGLEGIVWALHDVPVGDVWPLDQIAEVKKHADQYNLNIEVVESVNIHEDIKLGLPTRDQYIENYKLTIKNLAKYGVKVICYNFMPVFDWVRTELYKTHNDGATSMFLEKQQIESVAPMELVKTVSYDNSYSMPGWEPERLKHLAELFKLYEGVTEEDLWSHLQYFLEQVVPIAEQNDIKLAIHPDDPPYTVFGLPRIIKDRHDLSRLVELVDNKYNGITFCTGSLGIKPENKLEEMIKAFAERIHFVHIRNLRRYKNGDILETSHRTEDGDLNINKIVKTLHEIGFHGYARPDHGRQIWNENCRPGYGFYDRALGIMYLWGLWDAYNQNYYYRTKLKLNG